MQGVMRGVAGRDEEIRVQYPRRMVANIVNRHRIHVMNQKIDVDFVPEYAQITAVIPQNYLITDPFPLVRRVELLVDVAIQPESLSTDSPAEF